MPWETLRHYRVELGGLRAGREYAIQFSLRLISSADRPSQRLLWREGFEETWEVHVAPPTSSVSLGGCILAIGCEPLFAEFLSPEPVALELVMEVYDERAERGRPPALRAAHRFAVSRGPDPGSVPRSELGGDDEALRRWPGDVPCGR